MTYDSWLALDVECSAIYNIMLLIHALAASLCREKKQEMQSGVEWSSFCFGPFPCPASLELPPPPLHGWLGANVLNEWSSQVFIFHFIYIYCLTQIPPFTFVVLFCRECPMSVLACIKRQTGPWSMCLCFLSTSSSFLTSAHLPNSLTLLRARWFGEKHCCDIETHNI